MKQQEKPLYRKVNTKARGVHHQFGGDFRHVRNTKKVTREQILGSMHGTQRRGLDYTPLFKFLISKVGKEWDKVYSEVILRIDRKEPVFWLVALNEDKKMEVVRLGDSSFFTGLFVDQDGLLQIVNPNLKPTDITPTCLCCTHTLNGVPLVKKDG